ncbi:MAG: DNA-binding response regulator [Ilumatobacteraceae bacterium]|nr:DNA-binding response regulator [Ilumatobacteraceae bacterium]
MSIADPLVRDLIEVRSRRLGLTCERVDVGLLVGADEARGGDRSGSAAVVGAIDAEALELCGRDGVVGVLTHQSPPELLDLALTSTETGRLIVDPQIAARLARRLARAEPLGANRGLTDREHEILQLIARGLPLKQIAVKLGITTKTVENHTTKVYAKLGVRNRREAVAQITAAPSNGSVVAAGTEPGAG